MSYGEIIELFGINKSLNKIQFDFTVSKGLSKYFTNREFIIEYPENIEAVPDSIAAIPFVCNVIPITWLTNSKLIIPELDKSFYDCLSEVKKGYKAMYPESEFTGQLEVTRILDCNKKSNQNKAAMFYSGGLDSMDTLFRHLDEKPTLISIWGSDIKFDNVEGWNLVHTAIEEAAEHFDLEDRVIRSTFREFDNERQLSRDFSQQLQDNWWHGVKHGLALLGHVAPYAYLHELNTMYIASSNCKDDTNIRCASNPLIDNYVRYANCKVIHDGFEYSRQDKVRNILQFSERNQDFLPLHVCWKSQSGQNCCHCEKCYRTIVGILAEGGDPSKFGFYDYKKYLDEMIPVLKKENVGLLSRQWIRIQKRVIENKRELKKSSDWNHIKWMINTDFTNPATIQESIWVRVKKARGWRAKMAEFTLYQKLHELKGKLK